MSTQMFRKTLLALGATVALTAAALSSTAASAAPHGGHGGWHGGHGGFHGGFGGGRRWRGGRGFGFYGPAYVIGSECYIVRRGHRRIQVCD